MTGHCETGRGRGPQVLPRQMGSVPETLVTLFRPLLLGSWHRVHTPVPIEPRLVVAICHVVLPLGLRARSGVAETGRDVTTVREEGVQGGTEEPSYMSGVAPPLRPVVTYPLLHGDSPGVGGDRGSRPLGP